MIHKNTLKTEIDLVKTLRMITQTYEEISAMKMQRIRKSVIQTREFLEKLSNVFHEVKISYKKKVEKIEKEKKLKSKKTKSVSIFISANTKFYGDIVFRIFEIFRKSVSANEDDIMIVGRVGREYFEEAGMQQKYLYFEIPDIDLKSEDLRPLVDNLSTYDKINVFYGRFESIMNQVPVSSNISGEQSFTLLDNPMPKFEEKKYLFEPDLDNIVQFFTTQMVTSLFKQTVHESQLARFASRMQSMEEAIQKIDINLNGLYRQNKRILRQAENNNQLERLLGVSLWM